MGSIVMEPEDVESYTRIYHPGRNYSSICLSIGMVNSRGLFYNTNPLDYSVPLLLAQLSLASSVILFTTFFLKPLRQPSMVMQILGGLVLGPSFLGRTAGFTALVYPFESLVILDTLAVFGYMIYFFLIGVQLDPVVFKKIEKKDVIIGVSTVFLAMVLSISGAIILLSSGLVDKDIADSLPVVATSSSVLGFPVIAHYLTELKMVNSEFGRMALSSALISNTFGFCIITTAVLANENGVEIYKSVQTFISAFVLIVLMIFVIRPTILWALRRVPEGEPLKQGFILMVFVGVLMTGFFSKAVGLNIFFGPLLYGIIAIPAGPPLGSALVEKLDLITSWLFMPLYFVKNGLVTDVFSVELKNYFLVQFVILLACIGKFTGAVMSSIYNKVPKKEAIQIGLVMNVQGVLELGLFKMLKQHGAIKEEAFVVLCVSMLVVTATVTPILRYLHNPLGRRHAADQRMTVMDLPPDSELQIVACIHDQENVPTIINLVEILRPTRRSPIIICLLHLVELVGRAHPLMIPHKLNKVKSSKASTSKSIVNAFRMLQHSYQGIVTVHAFTSISPYETMHDQVCEMAFDRMASLIVVPFHRRLGGADIVDSSEKGIRNMNYKILETAPCTVVIIVDRSPALGSRPDSAYPQLRVAVFFIGGADDREALTIAARMTGQPNVNLTIIRLLPSANVAFRDEEETEFDNEIVNEIKSQLAGNPRVIYEEEVVGDGQGTVGVIKGMDGHFELIIVGRYHDTRAPIMRGLSDWGEGSELGAVGDMFVEADTNSNSTILVVQQNYESPGASYDLEKFYDGGPPSAATSIREGSHHPLRTNAV